VRGSNNSYLDSYVKSNSFSDTNPYNGYRDAFGSWIAFSAWSSGVAYNLNAQVIYMNAIWICTTAFTSGSPSAIAPNLDLSHWQYKELINSRKMFDGKTSSASMSTAASETVKLGTIPCDTIAFFGIQAYSITVRKISVSSGTAVWSQTLSTSGKTAAFVTFPEITYADRNNYDIEFTLNRDPVLLDAIILGELVMGSIINAGATKKGFGVSIEDYSNKTTDGYGNVSITPREFSSRLTIQSYLNESEAEQMNKLLSEYRSKLIACIGVDNSPRTYIYGFPASWDIANINDNENLLSLKMEGVV
jgi:hypothetical protein